MHFENAPKLFPIKIHSIFKSIPYFTVFIMDKHENIVKNNNYAILLCLCFSICNSTKRIPSNTHIQTLLPCNSHIVTYFQFSQFSLFSLKILTSVCKNIGFLKELYFLTNKKYIYKPNKIISQDTWRLRIILNIFSNTPSNPDHFFKLQVCFNISFPTNKVNWIISNIYKLDQ